MEKSNVTICLILALLSGCGDRDEAYYENNFDEAKQKITSCQKERLELIANRKYTEASRVFQGGTECYFAKKVVENEQRRKHEEYLKAKEEKENRKKEEVFESIKKEYGNLSTQEYVNIFLSSDCARKKHKIINNYDIDKKYYERNKNYKCLGMIRFYLVHKDRLLQNLSKLNLESLIKQENDYCKRDKRELSVCSIWAKGVQTKTKNTFAEMSYQELIKNSSPYCNDKKKQKKIICSSLKPILTDLVSSTPYVSSLNISQLEEQKKILCDSPISSRNSCRIYENLYIKKSRDIVNDYMSDFEKLKTDYNHCFDLLKNSKGSNKIQHTYPCLQAGKAADKLGVGSQWWYKKIQ